MRQRSGCSPYGRDWQQWPITRFSSAYSQPEKIGLEAMIAHTMRLDKYLRETTEREDRSKVSSSSKLADCYDVPSVTLQNFSLLHPRLLPSRNPARPNQTHPCREAKEAVIQAVPILWTTRSLHHCVPNSAKQIRLANTCRSAGKRSLCRRSHFPCDTLWNTPRAARFHISVIPGRLWHGQQFSQLGPG